MLYNPYQDQDQPEVEEYTFVEGKTSDNEDEDEGAVEDEKVVDVPPPITDDSVPKILYYLRQSIHPLLEPLYQFIGMIEGTLGGKSDAYWYKFKSGVHSAKQIQTISQIYSHHPHLHKQWIDDAKLIHFFSLDGVESPSAPKRAKREDFEDSECDSIEKRIFVGNGVDDAIEELAAYSPYGDSNAIENLWKAVLNNIAIGTIEMAKEEINTALDKDFTILELMTSPKVRGKFAQFVAFKLADGRNYNADNQIQGGRYIVAPSFSQMTARAKIGIGMKLWWRDVYASPNRNRAIVLQKIEEIQRQLDQIDYAEDPVLLRQKVEKKFAWAAKIVNARELTRIIKRQGTRRSGFGTTF